MNPSDIRIIALAVPHFNRPDFLQACLHNVLEDPRVAEIVVSDDCSQPSDYRKVLDLFGWVKKIRIFRNAKNQDCYRNKKLAVERATLPWVILFDDDNVMPKAYVDTLFALPAWHEDTVYCPEFAEPHFDYRAFAGLKVSRTSVARLCPRPNFFTALNTANYFFHRPTWLSVWDGMVDPHTADSIYQAYRLLDAGKKLAIVPGLRYFHRVHSGSHYKQNVHLTGDFARQVEQKLKEMR